MGDYGTQVLAQDSTGTKSYWTIDSVNNCAKKENLDSSIPLQDITRVAVRSDGFWIGNWEESKNYAQCGGIPSYLTDLVCSKGKGECISDELCKFEQIQSFEFKIILTF